MTRHNHAEDRRYNVAPPCEHCGERDHISEDCAIRPHACDRCGKVWTRDDLFWSGDDLIGDCCDPTAAPTACESCAAKLDGNDPDFCDTCVAAMGAARAAQSGESGPIAAFLAGGPIGDPLGELPEPVALATLKPGDRFTVAQGYLAPGGSSDAGVLTVSDASAGWGRVATTDGRALIGATRVHKVTT